MTFASELHSSLSSNGLHNALHSDLRIKLGDKCEDLDSTQEMFNKCGHHYDQGLQASSNLSSKFSPLSNTQDLE